MRMELSQLKKTSLYEQAIDSLLNYIIINDLKEGDKLPSENQLKDIFGISRNTLREAIKSLQLIGLIDTKQNSGIVIKNFTITDLTKFVPYTLNVEDKELRKLFEAREWLETSLLPMVVERRTDKDLDKLQKLIGFMDEAVSRKEDILELDFMFHQTIVECCANTFIVSIGSILRDFFTEHAREKKRRGVVAGESDYAANEEHKIIYNCISEKKLPMLLNIYKKHLARYNIPMPDCPS